MIDVIKKTILAGIIAEKIAEQGRREFEEMSQDLGTKVRAMLDRSDAETQARLTALEERVRVLEMNATPPPSRSSEP